MKKKKYLQRVGWIDLQNIKLKYFYILYNNYNNINNNKDIKRAQDNIKKSINELNEYYLQISLEHIIFNYTILSEDQYFKLTSTLNKEDNPLNIKKESLIKKLSYPKLPKVYNQYSSDFKDTRLSKGLFKRILNNGVQLFYKNNRIDLVLKEIEGLKFMRESKINKTL